MTDRDRIIELLKTAKSEAYKKFAEELDEEISGWVGADKRIDYFRVKQVVDGLLKNFTGDENGR